MKTKIIIFILALSLQTNLFGQGILAGDTTSPGIIYINIPNFSVSAFYPSSTICESLDIDGDGTDDLKFCAYVHQTMGSNAERTSAIGLNGAEISSYPTNAYYWINSFGFNDMISGSDPWGENGIFKSEEHYPDTSYYGGVFTNGYMGFRLYQGMDTVYGWVKITASSSHITVYEYAAYMANIVGIEQSIPLSEVTLFPNPCIKAAQFRFTLYASCFTAIDLYSISGMRIKRFKNEIMPAGEHEIELDMSELHDGLYFVRVQIGDKVSTKKLIISK